MSARALLTGIVDALPWDEDAPPACGHSACRQHWIDTGEADCIAEDGDLIDEEESE